MSLLLRLAPRTFAPPRFTELVRKFLRFYFRTFHSTTWRGLETLPPPGPCLFAANHQSYYDPMLIAAGQDLWMRFMAWDALFIGGVFEKLIRDYGAFPVDVEGSDPGGYRTCLELLRKADRICIFPEGERTMSGELLPFREGVARLAMKADVPVVPVCLIGADRAWPRGDPGPRLWFPIHVVYLPPVMPRPAHTPRERHEEAARITNEVRGAIQNCRESA